MLASSNARRGGKAQRRCMTKIRLQAPSLRRRATDARVSSEAAAAAAAGQSAENSGCSLPPPSLLRSLHRSIHPSIDRSSFPARLLPAPPTAAAAAALGVQPASQESTLAICIRSLPSSLSRSSFLSTAMIKSETRSPIANYPSVCDAAALAGPLTHTPIPSQTVLRVRPSLPPLSPVAPHSPSPPCNKCPSQTKACHRPQARPPFPYPLLPTLASRASGAGSECKAAAANAAVDDFVLCCRRRRYKCEYITRSRVQRSVGACVCLRDCAAVRCCTIMIRS